MSQNIVKVRAIDAVPYKFALWCCVGESEPFANTIVMREAWRVCAQRHCQRSRA